MRLARSVLNTYPRQEFILVAVGLAWVTLAFVVSSGLFTIDELIYLSAAEAFAHSVSLSIANGFEIFGSEHLRLAFLRDGPLGLVPQYPSGYTLLVSPLVAGLGARGLILLNALSAAGMLYLCRRLVLALSNDRSIANRASILLAVATFLPEYAFGLWPHALSGFLVLAVTTFVVIGVQHDIHPSSDRVLVVGGLVAGLGILVRVDTMLILAPLAIWMSVYAARPIQSLGLVVVGFVPGLLASAALNQSKFGTLLPITYGHAGTGGNSDPLSYLPLALLFVGTLIVLVSVRRYRRATLLLPAFGVLLAAVLLLTAISPSFHAVLARILNGLYVLIVDIRQLHPQPEYVEFQNGGGVTFWGLTKKALGQSLPWISVIALLSVRPLPNKHRRTLTLCFAAIVLWILPFGERSWHGGLGNNMRYFVPILPFFCILAAASWRSLSEIIADSSLHIGRDPPVSGALITFLLALALAAAAFDGNIYWFLQQEFSRATFILLFFLAVLAGVQTRFSAVAARAAQIVFLLAVLTAAILGNILDLGIAQLRRTALATIDHAIHDLPVPSLLYVRQVEAFPSQLLRQRGLLARAGSQEGRLVDHRLIANALRRGVRVFVTTEELVEDALSGNDELCVRSLAGLPLSRRIWEIDYCRRGQSDG